MSTNFGSRVFTTAVNELQKRYSSGTQFERLGRQSGSTDQLTANEKDFIAQHDTFYMATIGESVWPYAQHRSGPKGFLKVLDANTLAFADYRCNKQYISTGNLMTGTRVSLILSDSPRRVRLKLLGKASIFERDQAAVWLNRVQDLRYAAVIERVYVIRVEAFEWNCQQHVTERFTVEELRTVLEPVEHRVHALEEENARLRNELSALRG